MKILVVAPQPFYEERGTPIAVRHLVETLCQLGHSVDLLTYHAGADIIVPGLRIIRARRPPFVRRVPIGVSWQKLACNVLLMLRMFRLLRRNDYQVVHAVEEAVFPAVVLARGPNRRIVYDMDSWLSEQLVRKWTLLRPLRPLFIALERRAMRRAALVLPVCEDLAERVRPVVPAEQVVVLPDVPADETRQERTGVDSLREIAGDDAVIGLYVGNLERYQGIDLLLDGLSLLPAATHFCLIVIGGRDADVERYRKRSQELGIGFRVRFIGPRPLAHLNAYLAQADVLISPRAHGGNTPMKIYSYMQSGKAILATAIRSHTQVLDETCAILVPTRPGDVAAGIARLAADAGLREKLGAASRERAEAQYSAGAYRRRLEHAYSLLT